ncbi:MAG: protein kinase, partial [Gammaproteobacteria bacterium]
SVDKKILESTTNEVALLKNKFKNEFNNNDYFITFRDFAVSDKKSYLFMSFGGSQNGAKTIKALHEQKMINGKAQHEQQVKAIAKRYTQCVSELHKKGIHHRDIKPDNFFHGKNGIKLGDFGTATETGKEKIKGTENFFPGTLDFFPPEVLKKVIPSSKVVETNDYNQHSYTPEKHDAFSLGITLLQLKCGTLETGSLNILNEMAKVEKESIRLSENVYRNPFVKISIPDDPNADAIDNRIVHELNGETLDEVIAKLLVRDPEQRITPEDALRLPYFSSQNSQQELRMNNAK